MKTTITTLLAVLISICTTQAQSMIEVDETERARQDSLHLERLKLLYPITDTPHEVFGLRFIRTEPWTKISKMFFSFHPATEQLFTPRVEDSLLTLMNSRLFSFDSDTLTNKDFFYAWKPYFDWARDIDPHYVVMPLIDAPTRKQSKKIFAYLNKKQKQIPVTICCINDTLVVLKSFDQAFKSGDMLLAINDVPTSEYLKHSYNIRFTTPLNLMYNYDYSAFADNFKVEILRNGQQMTIKTDGLSSGKMFDKNPYNIQTYTDSNCGYICIKEFFANSSHLIKTVHSAIKEFKAQGITNVIIDVRQNPGGYGHGFDKLISMFTDKSSIPYMKGQKLRVSNFTLDYEFATKEMIGQNIDFPKGEFHEEIKLHPEMYVEGMKYYVLASDYTASTAATFVNILNYNNLAVFAGEPLAKNALKFGETIDLPVIYKGSLLSPLGVSTVEFDEHTNAIDGILSPDIFIPYVASEYMTGKDAVLEKLLQIIKNKE